MKTIYKSDKFDRLSPLAATAVILSILSAFYYLYYIFRVAEASDFILYTVLITVEVYVAATAVLHGGLFYFIVRRPSTTSHG